MKDTVVLVGTVGIGGNNLSNDVSLIQILMGLARSKAGGPYLTQKATGLFDTRTASAMAIFWVENGLAAPALFRSGMAALERLVTMAKQGLGQNASGPNSSLTFDGMQLCWVGPPHNGKCWRAVSGAGGFQSAEFQSIKNKGPLPEGRWRVRQDQHQAYDNIPFSKQIAGLIGHGTWPGGPIVWGRDRIWLKKQDVPNLYGRDPNTFSIHGGAVPGSAGCIDLTSSMPDFAEAFFRYGADMDLIVRYAKTKDAK